MTVQEILQLDSTITIGVGANQLKKIINTLKAYVDSNKLKGRLLKEVSKENDSLRREIEVLHREIQSLKNTTFSIRTIGEIQLGELEYKEFEG